MRIVALILLSMTVLMGQHHVMLNHEHEVSHAPMLGHDEHHEDGHEHDADHTHENGVFISASAKTAVAPTVPSAQLSRVINPRNIGSRPVIDGFRSGAPPGNDIYRHIERFLI